MCTPPDSPVSPRFTQPNRLQFSPSTPNSSPLAPARFEFPPLTPTDMEMKPAEIIAQGMTTPSPGASRKRFFMQESPNHVDEFVKQMGMLTPSPTKKQGTADKTFSYANINPAQMLAKMTQDVALVEPDEEAFRVPIYNKTKSSKKAPPPTPMQTQNPKRSRLPLTEDAQRHLLLMNQGKAIWGKFPLYYPELGKTEAGCRKGNFHQVWLLLPTHVRPEHVGYLLSGKDGAKKATVVKTPNGVEIQKSERIGDSLPICLQRVTNAYHNYLDLQRDKAEGKLPKGLGLAETHFYKDEAIIMQEPWDAEFDPEVDMLDPHFVEIVKEMLRKIENRDVSRADFKADNLGWVKVDERNLENWNRILHEILKRPFNPVKDMKNRKVMARVKNALQKSLKDQQMINTAWKVLDIKLENGEIKIVFGELKLFDFLEETDNESELTIEQFAGSFALDAAMHHYLHPSHKPPVETKE